MSGGEGILRDFAGNMLFAFFGFFGNGTSLQAEAKALFLRMKLCVQRGFIVNMVIESDSMMLVHIQLNTY